MLTTEAITVLALLGIGTVLIVPVLLLQAAANRTPTAARVRELLDAEQYEAAVRAAVRGMTTVPLDARGLGPALLSVNWELFYLARRAAGAWEAAPATLAAELESLRKCLIELGRLQELGCGELEVLRRERDDFRRRLRSRDPEERRAACASTPVDLRAFQDHTETRRRIAALIGA